MAIEDAVYLAKLAEQAERYEGSSWDSFFIDSGHVVDFLHLFILSSLLPIFAVFPIRHWR